VQTIVVALAITTLTLSTRQSPSAARHPGPYLVLALDRGDPRSGASRYSLVGVDEIEIGRGAIRTTRRTGRKLRIDVADPSLSSTHARLTSSDGGWSVVDAGSKNGTHVNGVPVLEPVSLDDGDLIDAARTLFVFVDPGGDVDPGDRTCSVTGDVLDTLDPMLAGELATIDRMARADVSVLVLGETGTGKELVARALHGRSQRAGRYVAVNCGAIPPTLIESELFGARRGAFSGAIEDRLGLVRAADGGTLFLDEIGELSPQSQAALLRVLQEREVVPVGAHAPIPVDLRVVAATCQDLPALIALDRFRRDLYARIAGFTFRLPPLRERRTDLGLLFGRLLVRHAPDRLLRVDRAAARALFRHDWPHNVRELEQAIASAIALAGDELQLQHLPASVRSAAAGAPARAAAPPRHVDRARLEALLAEHRGNVTRVADALATSRSQVRRLAARFALQLDQYRSGPR
jgi:pSer/pThr/pTyr-binding forkhead associated (FHA) protein